MSIIFKNSEHTPQLVLVTGLSGMGKTTWCAQLVKHAREKGLTVRGVLSPAVFEDGHKSAIDLIDLGTNERRRLAELRAGRTAELVTTQWQFDPEVMAWGDRVLGDVSASDLLIIDEFGPLEFLRQEGLMEGLRLIDERRYKVACVVVRSSLLPNALQRWPHGQVVNGTGGEYVGEDAVHQDIPPTPRT